MPNKKKRFFTKNNSTKYLLYTEGRDENGEKITQNVLVPVSGKHDLASSLLLSHFTNPAGGSNDCNIEENGEKETNTSRRATKYSESASDKDIDLDKILDGMAGSSDSEEEDDPEFEALKSKMINLGFFDEPNKSGKSHSKVHIEILDEDDLSDEFGQFSDAESDSDFESPQKPKKNRPVLTSAKADCPETLKILNEGFEKVLKEYTDDQIGGLDDEEICGVFTAENERVQDFIATPLKKDIKDIVIGEVDENIKQKILLYTEVEQPEHFVEVEMKKPLEWDCESILSTYSNKYNHPVVIKEESKIKKITIPRNPLKKSNLTKSQLKTLEESESESEEEDGEVSVATSFNIRVKDETPEQRRERKAMFKEVKRESRRLKKENKLAFKNEKKLQTAIAINARKNMGIKLV